MAFHPGGVRFGRIVSLLEGLPVDAAVAVKLRGDPPGAWARSDMLLAHILESLDVGHRIAIKVWTSKPPKLGEPLRIEYPGRRDAEKPRRRPSTKAEIAAFLGKRRIRVIDGGQPDGA